MKNLKTYIGISILASSMILTACSTNPNEAVYGEGTQTETTADATPYEKCLNLISPKAYNDTEGLNFNPGSVVSMITPTSSTPYWDVLKKGAFQAIEDINTSLGYTGKDKIVLSFNTASNVDDQINILDSELSRYPAAIAVVPLDSTAFGMQFDQAMENGIPIVTFETPSMNNNISAMIGTDQEVATKELIKKFSELSETPEHFFIVTSDASTSANDARIKAALSTLPDGKIENTAGTIIDLSDLSNFYEVMAENDTNTTDNEENTTDNEDSDSSEDISENTEVVYNYSQEEVMTFILDQYGDCKNFLVLDGEACNTLIKTLDTLTVDYANYNILSFDSSADQLAALETDKINGLQLTNPYGTGYASIIASIRAALEAGNEAFISTGHMYLDKASAKSTDFVDFIY